MTKPHVPTSIEFAYRHVEYRAYGWVPKDPWADDEGGGVIVEVAATGRCPGESQIRPGMIQINLDPALKRAAENALKRVQWPLMLGERGRAGAATIPSSTGRHAGRRPTRRAR